MYTNTNCLNVRIFVNIDLLNDPNKLIIEIILASMSYKHE